MGTLQFPPPSNESIELVENLNLLSDIEPKIELVDNLNLLSDIEPETLEVQKLHRWQSDLHLLKSRFSVIEISHNTLKKRLKGLYISTVALTVLVILILIWILITGIQYYL